MVCALCESSFRPLPGVLSSQFADLCMGRGLVVSVPFRGFYLLNEVVPTISDTLANLVSVPFWGFYLLNMLKKANMQWTGVSVPFRGFYLLNSQGGFRCWNPGGCFRPLPGFLSSQLEAHNKYRSRCTEFPSPSGVSIFSILAIASCYQNEDLFPSPSGVSIFSISG